MQRDTIRPVLAAVLAVPLLAGTARAHVDYVVTEDPDTFAEAMAFLAAALADPLNLAVLGAGAVGLVGALAGYLWLQPFGRDVAVFRDVIGGYADLLPWLVRISFGFPLVGAGFAGYYISPSVEVPARVLQVGIGFLILFGLATRAAAVVGLVAYVVGLFQHPQLLLAQDYVTGFLAILLLGSGRPSADHVLRQVAEAEGTFYGQVDRVHRLAAWTERTVEPYQAYLPTLVRVGLGLNFVYLGVVQKLMAPSEALAVVTKYGLQAVVPVPPELWVVGAGLTEMAVGLALIAGLFTRGFSLVAFGLFTTTLFGLPDDPVLAHLSLYGLVSVLLITGSGPFALDNVLATPADDEEPGRPAPE